MTVISGVGSIRAPRTALRRTVSGGFHVPEPAVDGLPVVSGAAMPSLLALQEAGQDAARDRDAREHGSALLHALDALQRTLLGGGEAGVLRNLASLADAAPTPADPRLLSIQRAILVRVAVELSRTEASR